MPKGSDFAVSNKRPWSDRREQLKPCSADEQVVEHPSVKEGRGGAVPRIFSLFGCYVVLAVQSGHPPLSYHVLRTDQSPQPNHAVWPWHSVQPLQATGMTTNSGSLNCQRVTSSLTVRGAQSRFSVEDASPMCRRATRIMSIRGATTKSSSASDECVCRPVGQPRGRSPRTRFQHCRSMCTGTTTNRILP